MAANLSDLALSIDSQQDYTATVKSYLETNNIWLMFLNRGTVQPLGIRQR